MSESKRRLLVGYKAADLRPDLLCGDVTVHELDIYHAHAVEKTHPGAKVVCTPHLPEGPWDEILFRTGPKLMSGELSLDLLQEIAQLAGGDLRAPKFQLDFVGRERDRNDLLNKVRDDPKRVRNFSSVWPASVPGGPKLMFTSFPGCFCHRRLDEGGLALAEVVAKELMERQALTSCLLPLSLLDMGCGCGLVGLLVGSVVKGLRLTMVDSHTRAVEAAELNAKAFGADARVILADDGLDSVQSANHPIEQSNNRTFEHFFLFLRRLCRQPAVLQRLPHRRRLPADGEEGLAERRRVLYRRQERRGPQARAGAVFPVRRGHPASRVLRVEERKGLRVES